jgi:molybdopterin-guanine dinucleotide biosynthesis protein A
MRYDGVVLAGGRGSRLGGADKPAIVIGDRSMLDVACHALAGAQQVTVVGPEVDGGPVAALAAGLRSVTADLVVVLAADLPFVTEQAVLQLVNAVESGPGAVAVDSDGRVQPLLACYRVADLLRAMPASPSGTSMRRLLRDIGTLQHLNLGGEPPVCWDCDTPADLHLARELA